MSDENSPSIAWAAVGEAVRAAVYCQAQYDQTSISDRGLRVGYELGSSVGATATQTVTDKVITKHTKHLLDVAQASIDGLTGKTVTINLDGAGMFERFTDRARRVVVLAQEQARTLDHNHIGTEHLLLGLIHEGEGVGAQAIKAAGVNLERCREQVEKLIGRGDKTPSGHIPFTPRGKKVLEYALREALQLGHNYIGTEHILLALIREGEGVGAKALTSLGAELDAVRKHVLKVLAAQPKQPPDLDALLKSIRVDIMSIALRLQAAGY